MSVQKKLAPVAQTFLQEQKTLPCHICGDPMSLLRKTCELEVYECPECGPDSDTLIYNKNESLLTNESDSLYYNDIHSTLLLSNDENDYKKRWRTQEYELLSRFESISASPATMTGYKIFLKKGVSFAKELETLGEMAEPTSHRVINNLLDMNLIEPVVKVRFVKGAGDRPTLYGVQGDKYYKDEITSAAERYKKSRFRSYRYVQRLYQEAIGYVRDNKILYRELVGLARKQGSRELNFLDIAHQVGEMMQENDIMVIQ